jgi:hypothetical protein
MPLNILNGKTCDPEALLALVNDCKTKLQLLRNEHGNLFPHNPRLHPVPFFGNPFQAVVLTVALNPSFTEFNPGRGWEEELDAQNLISKLLPYFERDPHIWFNQLEKALLYFGSSYEINAAHIDLFPHPTLRPRNMGNDQRRELADLIRLNAHHFQHVLKLCRSVKLVLVMDYTFRYDLRNQLSVFTTLQEFIPAAAQNNGQTFPTICFSGPNSVGEWAFKNRHFVRKHLREAHPIEF